MRWVIGLCLEQESAGTQISRFKEVKENSKVLIPRVVGHKTPESGNHFILWVFDGLTSEIRLYDSLGKNKTIEAQDMELLCNAFQNIWDLGTWTIKSPAQWKQSDSDNCGVFVCTIDELHEKIQTALCLDKKDLRSVDFILDVMLPEVTLEILCKHEGFHRYQGEMSLATSGAGYKHPQPSDQTGEDDMNNVDSNIPSAGLQPVISPWQPPKAKAQNIFNLTVTGLEGGFEELRPCEVARMQTAPLSQHKSTVSVKERERDRESGVRCVQVESAQTEEVPRDWGCG
ncbi:hypothetical protein SRHO_G00001970 [Serrasalmus rhombeus]